MERIRIGKNRKYSYLLGIDSMKKWKVYIVGHSEIHEETVNCDRRFNNENYNYLNVGCGDTLINSEKYVVINQRELDNCELIGKYWAESEGIYNIWRSRSFEDLDYIGFIHYDVKLEIDKKYFIGKKNNITERINKYIKNRERGHISFATYSTRDDFAMRVMMDPQFPNECVGEGRNCYYSILEDYNSFFNTRYTINDFLSRPQINLCSCFLIDVETFDKMMHFFDWLVKSHKLDIYDTEHKYRFQGGMAERYFGLFMLFEYDKMKNLNLVHMYNAGWK